MKARTWYDLQFWVSTPVAGGSWHLNCTVIRFKERGCVRDRDVRRMPWKLPLAGSPCTTGQEEWKRQLARGKREFVHWARAWRASK